MGYSAVVGGNKGQQHHCEGGDGLFGGQHMLGSKQATTLYEWGSRPLEKITLPDRIGKGGGMS